MELRIGSLSLTGGNPSEGAGDLQIAGAGKVQVSEAIGAAGIDLQNRGNYQHLLTWSVSREHRTNGKADPEAAAYFVAKHFQEVEAVGKSVLTYKTEGGTLYFAPAIASVTKGYAEGCRTFHAYRVIAGIITDRAPVGAAGGDPGNSGGILTGGPGNSPK